MKNIFYLVLLCSATLNSARAEFVLWTEMNSSMLVEEPDNPFKEGIERLRLSDSERADLLPYTNNSKAKLQNALEEGSLKTTSVANEIYFTTIKEVVLESYRAQRGRELLLRFALNQALELSYGLPSEDGISLLKEPILSGSQYSDLHRVILEDSMRLAIRFYEDERAALDMSDKIMHFSLEKLKLSREWLRSVWEWKDLNKAEEAILRHWAATALSDDQLKSNKFAEEILPVDDVLRLAPPTDTSQYKQRVRQMRKVIRELEEGLSTKLFPNSGSDKRRKTQFDFSEEAKGISTDK